MVRQRKAIQAFANRAGYPIIAWFDDPSVVGADTIDTRPSFLAALEMIAGNGVRTGHGRDREPVCPRPHCPGTGWKRLNADGITLIADDAPEQFVDEFGKFWVPLPSLIKR